MLSEKGKLPHTELIKAKLTEELGPISKFNRLSTPFENRDFYDVAIVEAADKKVVVKWDETDTGDKGWRKNPKDQLEMEYELSGLLLERGVPTAAPILLDKRIPMFVMEYLPGREATKEDFDSARIAEAATILKKIHSVREGEPGTEHAYRWPGESFVEETTLKFEERFKGSKDQLDPDLAERVEQAFHKAIRTDYVGVKRLCRRDLHPGNWYLHENGKLFVIDHGQIGFNDIAYDLSMVRERLATTKQSQEVFRESYGPKEYDASSLPEVEALMSLNQQLGTLGWLKASKQPKYREVTMGRLIKAVELVESLQ